MAKYDPLFEFLCKEQTGPLEVRFGTIEEFVGVLPVSATKYTAW